MHALSRTRRNVVGFRAVKQLLVTAATLTALALASASASAQDWEPKKQGFRIGGALDVWPTQDFVVLGWDFEAQIQTVKVVMIDVDVPFAFATGTTRGNTSQFIVGNPSVGAHWADKVSQNVAVYAGGAIAFPTMLAATNDGTVAATAVGADTMRAYGDFERFVPWDLSVVIKGGVEWRILPVLFLRGDLGLGIHPPINNHRNVTYTTIAPSAEIEYRLRMGFGFGGRLQAVFFPGQAPALDDRVQTAFEPFIGYEAPGRRGFFFRLGLITALDEQLGWATDRDKVATVHLNMGGKF